MRRSASCGLRFCKIGNATTRVACAGVWALCLNSSKLLRQPVGAAAVSWEAQEFSRESVHAWAAAVQGSGAATAEQFAAVIEVSLSQFAPDLANQAPSQDQQASG